MDGRHDLLFKKLPDSFARAKLCPCRIENDRHLHLAELKAFKIRSEAPRGLRHERCVERRRRRKLHAFSGAGIERELLRAPHSRKKSGDDDLARRIIV